MSHTLPTQQESSLRSTIQALNPPTAQRTQAQAVALTQTESALPSTIQASPSTVPAQSLRAQPPPQPAQARPVPSAQVALPPPRVVNSYDYHSLILQEQQVHDQIHEINDQIELFSIQRDIFTSLIDDWQRNSWATIEHHQRALAEYQTTVAGSYAEHESWRIVQDWEMHVRNALKIQQDLAEDRFFLELLMGQMQKDVEMLQEHESGILEAMNMQLQK